MNIIKCILSFFLSIGIAYTHAQQVPESIMDSIYQEVKTPYKYGMVLVPSDDTKKMDCPTVFRKNNHWYMTYIQFDGRGYETWLAKSEDLLQWKTLGKLLTFNDDTTVWDAHQKAGYISLEDYTWGGTYEIQQYKGKYWMGYFGGNTKGYEAGLLSTGMAYTKKDITQPHEWKTLDSPILASTDKDVRWWEDKKQYKNTVIWDKQQTTGYPFVMYYNANGDTSHNRDKKTRWFERIGMAVSNDMVHWQRFKTDPVMHHEIGITGDAVIQKINDVWMMFYFGAFWEERKDAFNRFACSYNLVDWTDWKGEDLIHSSEPFDAKYAHKSFVVKWDGVVYHFYNAVNNKDQRGIAVATSVDKGKSELQFVQ